jgi:ABC-type Fe3+ transport system substrate-binding protein
LRGLLYDRAEIRLEPLGPLHGPSAEIIQGHLGVARGLGSGESLISFDNTIGSTNTARREGGKIALAPPASDRMPMFFTSEAILKDAPHPNAAKLYVSWFLSKEQQTRIGVYTSRSDVRRPKA